MNLANTFMYNLNSSELAEWCEEVFPNENWESGEFAMMELKDEKGRIVQIQVKVTRNQDEFLATPRIKITST